MTEKRFKIAVFDDKAIHGFAVLDLQKLNNSKRLKYENIYIGSEEACEIVCNFGNSLAEENEQLKSENERLQYYESRYRERNLKLEKENNELKHTIKTYKKGNKLLKTTLDEIKKENSELKQFKKTTTKIIKKYNEIYS